jgi:hypothetical protein
MKQEAGDPNSASHYRHRNDVQTVWVRAYHLDMSGMHPVCRNAYDQSVIVALILRRGPDEREDEEEEEEDDEDNGKKDDDDGSDSGYSE